VIQYDPGLHRIYALVTAGRSQSSRRMTQTSIGNWRIFLVTQKVRSFAVDLETHRLYAPGGVSGREPGGTQADLERGGWQVIILRVAST
jgi:hypothetical protein